MGVPKTANSGEKMTIVVNFYLSNESNWDVLYRQTCKIIEKHFHPDKKIYIYVDNPTIAQQLDTLLWTFHDTSFLPHTIYKDNADFSVPILIGSNANSVFEGDILVNLTTNVPNCYQQFKQVFEVVPNEENYKKSARERYKFYKSQNCKLETHNLE